MVKNIKVLFFMLLFSFNGNSWAENTDLDLLKSDFELPPVAKEAHQSLHPNKVQDRGLFLSLKLIKSEKAKILIGLGAVGIFLAFDQQVMDLVQDSKAEDSTYLANFGDHIGSSDFLPGFLFGTLGVGLVFKNDKLKTAAYRSIKAAAISGLVTETIKALTHRKRPNTGEGPYVFEGAYVRREAGS
jgi:hypothetical protein